MNRQEAIQIIKNNWPNGRHMLSEALEFLIPELKESEDERIKRCIGMCLTDATEQRFEDFNTTLKDCLVWLEKQGRLMKALQISNAKIGELVEEKYNLEEKLKKQSTMKEQVIQFPNNFEVKEIKDGKIVLVEKEKKVTYEDIAKELFANKKAFYITTHGISEDSIIECFAKDSNNCTSRKQAEKLLAINRLMNVAKYLNEDWQPDWDYRHEKKYYIHVEDEQVKIYYVDTVQCGDVYFKSEELAKQAIEILGKETIKLALCTDY